VHYILVPNAHEFGSSIGQRLTYMAGPTPRPFAKAFACAAVAFVVAVIAVFSTLEVPASSYVGVKLLTRLILNVSVPALVAGFFARRSTKVWSIWKIIALYVLVLVIVHIASVAGTAKTPS